MKYQAMKIRDSGRLAVLTLGLTLIVVVGVAVRGAHLDQLDRPLAMLAGLAFMCPVSFAVCVYYMISSPAQNERFLRWAERHRRGRPPLDFDWKLLDPSDPDYDTPTIRTFWPKGRAAKIDSETSNRARKLPLPAGRKVRCRAGMVDGKAAARMRQLLPRTLKRARRPPPL